MKIKWKKVKELTSGHGVLFIHKYVDASIAFLVGYRWYHDDTYNVTAEILERDLLSEKYPTVNIDIILNETKRTVRIFIQNKELKHISPEESDVYTWYNA